MTCAVAVRRGLRRWFVATMAALEDAVRAYVDAAGASAQGVAACLESGGSNLTALVVALGPCLTHADARQRARGIDLIAEVLALVSPGRLDARERSLLATFLAERLVDGPCVGNVLPAIASLVARHGVTGEDAATLSRALFSDAPVQALPQTARHAALSALDALVRTRGDELAASLGADFVLGFVQSVDGEKDPRNLMVAFRLARDVARRFPAARFAEELFEVTACYFPITFRPPPNDPHGITREGLAAALRGALAASDLLAPHVFPLLVEKLGASGADAKAESLAALSECVASYSPATTAAHGEELWTALRVEALHGGEVEKEALLALADVARALSRDAALVGPFVVPIAEECARHMREPEVRLAQSSSRVLGALASSSPEACAVVFNVAVPVAIAAVQAASPIALSPAADNLVNLLIAGKEAKAHEGRHPIAQHASAVVPLLFFLIRAAQTSVRRAAIAAIVAVEMSDSAALNAQDTVSELVRVLLEDADAAVRAETLSALCFFASRHVPVVAAAVPALLARAASPDEHGERALHALAAVARGPALAAAVVPGVVASLAAAPSPATARAAECLVAIARGNATSPETVAYLARDAVPAAVSHTVALVCGGAGGAPVADVARFCLEVVSAAPTETQRGLVDFAMRTFVDSPIEGFAPLAATPDSPHARALPLFASIVGAVDEAVAIPGVAGVIARMAELACVLRGPPAVAAAKCAAALVNKLGDGDATSWAAVSQSLEGAAARVGAEGLQAVVLLAWTHTAVNASAAQLSKALEMRGHPLATAATGALFRTLSVGGAVGETAAEGFGVVMGDADDLLTRQTHARIRLLYKQRVFTQNVQSLVQGHATAQDDAKGNYLTALSHMLQNIPKQVLLGALPPLVPLLVRSLAHSSASLRAATVRTIYGLVFDAPDVVAAHASTLVPLLLARSRDEDSMKVRIAALECLGAMTSLPAHILLPLKHTVTRSLAASLDDKKRLVRAEAAKCRSQWFMFDAPVAPKR